MALSEKSKETIKQIAKELDDMNKKAKEIKKNS